MGRTFIRQDTQIRRSDTYDDTVAPSLAAYETNPVNVEDDLNNVRSMLAYLKDIQSGNWYDAQTAPSTLEAGVLRGVDDLNDALHLVEKQRVGKRTWGIKSISGGALQGVILGAGELPTNTTAAIGAVTTLGAICATATTFGTFSASDVVSGPTAINPLNLVMIVDSATRDPILDASDRRVYGLLQVESAVDGSTITATTPNRAQLSYVVVAAGALQLAAAGTMTGVTFDYDTPERTRLEDLVVADWLGGADVDVPAGATVTRQNAYDNQGTTPVDVTTNSTLDLEGAGLLWLIRDDLEANLFGVVEGSAGGTSQVNIYGDVDEFDVDAAVVDFAQGTTHASGKTRPITIGVNDGLVETTAGDLEVKAANELLLNDTNMVNEGTWTGPGVKVSETTTEVAAYETEFGGEVSLMNAIVQAAQSGARGTKVYAVVTSTTVADTDVGGVGGGANLDAQLPDMSGGSFLTDYDVFLNGELLRPGADAAANHDYYPGTSLVNGQLKFEFVVKTNDVICVIPYA